MAITLGTLGKPVSDRCKFSRQAQPFHVILAAIFFIFLTQQQCHKYKDVEEKQKEFNMVLFW